MDTLSEVENPVGRKYTASGGFMHSTLDVDVPFMNYDFSWIGSQACECFLFHGDPHVFILLPTIFSFECILDLNVSHFMVICMYN